MFVSCVRVFVRARCLAAWPVSPNTRDTPHTHRQTTRPTASSVSLSVSPNTPRALVLVNRACLRDKG
jgi:hypothetical protein